MTSSSGSSTEPPAPEGRPRYQDPAVPIADRVRDLLDRMTLDEKIGQMVQVFNPRPEYDEGIRAGDIGSCVIVRGPLGDEEVDDGVHTRALNRAQQIAVTESRLGIPLLFARDVIHGYRTVFPIPLGQAAMWNPECVRACAEISAREAASAGIHWVYAPMVEVCRDPRWGRVAEGLGEDPHLASRLAEAAVQGYQGDDLSQPDRVAACAKHFVGYSAAEGGRDYDTVTIGERALRDIYMPPFRAAARAGVATMMTSFNEIDGVPVSADRRLITDIAKYEWNWDGFFISDARIIGDMCEFGVAKNLREAAALCAAAGVDMDLKSDAYREHLAALVREGVIAESEINEMVRRILQVKFGCGLFERPYAPEKSRGILLAPAHRQAARKAAAESFVLLKNNGILPLAREGGGILVSGPLAHVRRELSGTWALDALGEDVRPLGAALRDALEGQREVIFDDEPDINDFTSVLIQKADTVVVFLGEGHKRTGERKALASLDLPVGQMEKVRTLRALGKPIVAVVCAGRPLAIGELCECADAVLYAWHPGVEAGTAVADVLLGDAHPGGRTPMSFPRTAGHVPTYYAIKPIHRNDAFGENRKYHYRDQLTTPLFPFGFGLDYTTYAYRDLRIQHERVPMDGVVTLSAVVENTGDRAGTEVVQLYAGDVLASVTRPIKELKGFKKIALNPGEKQTVTFELRAENLAFTGRDFKPVTEPGEFLCWIGPNAAEGLEGRFELVANP